MISANRPKKYVAMKEDVIAFFGNKISTAAAFGISPSAITQWPDVIPEVRARQLVEFTNGAFTKVRIVDADQFKEETAALNQ